MEKFILDTDVVIDYLAKKDPGFSLVKQVLDQDLKISVITWVEFVYGLKKEHKAAAVDQFRNFLDTAEIDTFPINTTVGDVFTDLKVELEAAGKKLPDFDLMIAATTLTHNCTLVTRNKRYFERIAGLQVY